MPLVAPVTKSTRHGRDTDADPGRRRRGPDRRAAPAPRPGLPRPPAGRVLRRRGAPPRRARGAGRARPGRRGRARAALLAEAARPVIIAGSDVWAGRAESPRCGRPRRCRCRCSPTAWAAARARRTPAACRQGPPRGAERGRRGRRGRHAARLPARLRRLRRRDDGPARSCTSSTPRASARHTEPAVSAPATCAVIPASARRRRHRLVRPTKPLDRGPPGRRARRGPATPRRCADTDPIQPARVYGELRRPPGRDAVTIGDGGDFVSYAGRYLEPDAARRLARPRPVRLPRHRHGLRDGARVTYPDGRSAAARRRRGRLLADGRRVPGPARPAGGDGGRQQRHLGPGEAPDAGDVRLRRRRRPAARPPVRRRGERARRGRRDGDRAADIGPALDRAFAAGVAVPGQRADRRGAAYPRKTTGV